MKYELKIHILDQNYVDQLVVALVRQGYDVYYNADENVVCFTGTEEDVYKIKERP